MKALLLILSILLPNLALAKLPGDPYYFDQKKCVKENLRICLKGVCIPGTPTDCRAQCRINAQNKCRAISQQEQF